MSKPHTIIFDHDPDRLNKVAAGFQQQHCVVHATASRSVAFAKLLELVARGVMPRAFIFSWLVDDKDLRDFYSLVNQEVTHTVIPLINNTLMIDRRHGSTHTNIICYADYDLLDEAVREIKHEGWGNRVAVVHADLNWEERAAATLNLDPYRLTEELSEERAEAVARASASDLFPVIKADIGKPPRLLSRGGVQSGAHRIVDNI